MSTLKILLSKIATITNLTILFILSHSILLFMLTYTFPAINTQIGTNAFDLQTFGYSFTTTKDIIKSLNEHATSIYIFPQLTLLDLFYPILLATFLSSFLLRLKIITYSKFHSWILLIPFIAMLCDYLENVFILLMITKTIELTESFVFVSSTLTILKSTFTTIAWITVLYYSFKWLKIRLLKRQNEFIDNS